MITPHNPLNRTILCKRKDWYLKKIGVVVMEIGIDKLKAELEIYKTKILSKTFHDYDDLRHIKNIEDELLCFEECEALERERENLVPKWELEEVDSFDGLEREEWFQQQIGKR